MRGRAHTHSHTLTHTHTHSHIEPLLHQEAEEESGGGYRGKHKLGILQWTEPIQERDRTVEETHVLICFRAPQGKLSTREFDRISVHLLHGTLVS